MLAHLPTVVGGLPPTHVAVAVARSAVADRHAGAALAANQKTLKQRRTFPGRAHRLRPCPVGRKALEVSLVLLPGDVRRQAVLDEDVPRLRWGHRAPGGRTTGFLLAGIDSATTVSVGSGVDRVFEQVLQRHPVGAAPFELALCLPLADSDAELDAVLDQVGKHGVQGSEFLELAEDEPNHPLDFLVRIEGHLARRPPRPKAASRSRWARGRQAHLGEPCPACPDASVASRCAVPPRS